jgi:hypothetical protein
MSSWATIILVKEPKKVRLMFIPAQSSIIIQPIPSLVLFSDNDHCLDGPSKDDE